MAMIGIRPLLLADWGNVSDILAASLGASALEDEPLTWEQWDRRYLPDHRLVAANREGQVTGWAALEPVSARRSLNGVGTVSVFVDAGHRGQGFGNQLLASLIASSEDAGMWTLQAYVAPQNSAAMDLFQDLGFRIVGRRQRFVRLADVWHDAMLLERRSPVVFPEAVVSLPEIHEAS
ncbi:MAG: GNAT family N-acetyltransferase [Bifidobacteriaceae bacterium]|jgi:phosphinothricin acetyltransferase|nr:GNAT family N-acetyltransferase [Bifidobacteriaceae bacterium]